MTERTRVDHVPALTKSSDYRKFRSMYNFEFHPDAVFYVNDPRPKIGEVLPKSKPGGDRWGIFERFDSQEFDGWTVSRINAELRRQFGSQHETDADIFIALLQNFARLELPVPGQ